MTAATSGDTPALAGASGDVTNQNVNEPTPAGAGSQGEAEIALASISTEGNSPNDSDLKQGMEQQGGRLKVLGTHHRREVPERPFAAS